MLVRFFLTAILLGTIRCKKFNLHKQKPQSIRTEFLSGLTYLRKKPALISLASITFMFNFFYGPYEVVLPYVVFRNLKMQKNAALRYTAFCIKIQDWTGVTVEHKPPLVQQE